MLVDKFPNVSPDLTMLPIISTRASIAMLHDLLERSTAERLFGAATHGRRRKVMAPCWLSAMCWPSPWQKKLAEGYFSREDTLLLIDQILYDNPNNYYKVWTMPMNVKEVKLP